MTTLNVKPFLLNPYTYRRRKTRVVHVGNVAVGGTNPLRLQSMTTTSTNDIDATVEQTKRLADAGCEIVRITAPTIREARALGNIKSRLIQDGCAVPLVADIHFNPAAAMEAADFVEKIRINPGNFVDGKAFKVREYTDEEYTREIERIEEKFTPLVLKLKKHGRSLRIGTNHGSLSDRIMNRYGDTPLGMVESALEYTRVCRKNDFHDIIFSMKASNPRVMIAAYRLLAERLDEDGWDYPFHLGVTEAGDGEDGRIKSAVGIGSLLEDGIGDTIRVSLTEDPEYEIPVARTIAARYNHGLTVSVPPPLHTSYIPSRIEYSKRETNPVRSGPITIGGGAPVRVVQSVSLTPGAADSVLKTIEERAKTDTLPEILVIPNSPNGIDEFRARLSKETSRVSIWIQYREGEIPANPPKADGSVYEIITGEKEDWKNLRSAGPLVLTGPSIEPLIQSAEAASREGFSVILGVTGAVSVHAHRALIAELRRRAPMAPVLLPPVENQAGLTTAMIHGSLICDGIGDAVWVNDISFSYNLLQATGARITKTEFVSCPSCGRTLFDLQTTTERIKSKTGHLKGVKIAIMGCIVNGPGEMADADFGYVGGGPGRINLYVGKTCVEKSIPMESADDRLIALIKSHGKWQEPK